MITNCYYSTYNRTVVVIHEEQITDSRLNGYEMLFMCDIKLLPQKQARVLASYVENGGVIIADCVPDMGRYKEPLDTLNNLFGIDSMVKERIIRTGHYVNTWRIKPYWIFKKDNDAQQDPKTAHISGEFLGKNITLPLVSYRPIDVNNAEVLLDTVENDAVVLRRKVGKGAVYLIGFCLQDTYFNTWKEFDQQSRGSLRQMVRSIINDAGIKSHIYSSNPDIEASLRANDKQGFIFLINHESLEPQTRILLNDLPFKFDKITDLATSKEVDYTTSDGYIELEVNLDLGKTMVLKLN